jgi:transposase
MEVAMRPPEVFVRELSPEEGSRLKSISKKARYQSKRQRAMIVLASSTGMSAPQIAGLVRSDESHVRKVIHAFNQEGFGSLDPDYRGGRPKKTTPEQRDQIIAVARARPDTQGVALTRWSLAKLSEHLAGLGVVLCEEALRQTLRAAGLSHQRTRSWKWSPDPDFAEKAQRVLGLYRTRPDDGVVVCFDEMGPIQLIPHHGSAGPRRSGPSGCARPTPRSSGCATCSARARRPAAWAAARAQERRRGRRETPPRPPDDRPGRGGVSLLTRPRR